jgi:hypothetical protein
VLGATVAACSGQGTTSPGPVVCPDFIAVYTATLVQPPNGAVGVSTTLGTIVATTNPFNTQGLGENNNVTLLVNGNLVIEGGVFTPIPSPNNSPSYSATIPTLAPHTTYQVDATVPRSPGPCELPAWWSIGSFTTQ